MYNHRLGWSLISPCAVWSINHFFYPILIETRLKRNFGYRFLSSLWPDSGNMVCRQMSYFLYLHITNLLLQYPYSSHSFMHSLCTKVKNNNLKTSNEYTSLEINAYTSHMPCIFCNESVHSQIIQTNPTPAKSNDKNSGSKKIISHE